MTQQLLDFFHLSTENQQALYAMAHEFYANGKFHDSKRFFHLLTLLEPKQKKYWLGLAASYQMLKEYTQAIEFYSVAAIQDPNDPYIHLYAADCFLALGDTDSALKALNSAQMTANEDGDLMTKLQLMKQAWSHQKQRKEPSYG